MNVAVLCKSDSKGGAAIVSRRLTEALNRIGVKATMLVTERLSDAPYVVQARYPLLRKPIFLAERLGIYMADGFSKENLFKIDTGEWGLPLWSHPVVKEADAVIINWVNQGMLSLSGVEKICKAGKKVIWTMHDLWNFTGICHHSMHCRHFESQCGNCFLLGKKSSPSDLSHKIWKRKKQLYDAADISFVAVSSWLADLAKKSSLMSKRPIHLIPNPIDVANAEAKSSGSNPERKRIIFSAARLDDPIKGLDILKHGIARFAEKYPELASRSELMLMGSVKEEERLDDFAIKTTKTGMIKGDDVVENIFRSCDAVISTSLFENLPGTLIEGQLYGCVPVAFDRGGQRDIIDNPGVGVLMPWSDSPEERSETIADSLHKALTADEDIKRRMQESVREKFSYEAVAKKYLDLLKKTEN